jgi:hypothetical protein
MTCKGTLLQVFIKVYRHKGVYLGLLEKANFFHTFSHVVIFNPAV